MSLVGTSSGLIGKISVNAARLAWAADDTADPTAGEDVWVLEGWTDEPSVVCKHDLQHIHTCSPLPLQRH